WITAFIFAAQDYNWHNCILNKVADLWVNQKKTSGQLHNHQISNGETPSVVVLGINSYLINKGPRGLFITYLEVVAVVSVVAFLPAFVAPFLSNPFKDFVLFIDVVFSYLWITAFTFAAVNYNQNNCHLNAPPGVVCSKKWALEAFVFLTFIFTFFALFIETLSLWKERKDQGRDHSQEKIHNSSLDNSQTEPSVPPNEAQNTEYPAAMSSVV
ncbi:hypothetical protein N7450_005396, partial [Penicillium hetheringtonii]